MRSPYPLLTALALMLVAVSATGPPDRLSAVENTVALSTASGETSAVGTAHGKVAPTWDVVLNGPA